MKRQFFIQSFLIITVVFSACSRSGSSNPSNGPHTIDFNDTSIPLVEIYTPGANQTYLSGDTIKITGRITDNGLYQGYIRVTNDANNEILKEQLYEVHGLQLYNFSLNYKTAVTVASNYTITVSFEDHGHNRGTRMVNVKVNP